MRVSEAPGGAPAHVSTYVNNVSPSPIVTPKQQLSMQPHMQQPQAASGRMHTEDKRNDRHGSITHNATSHPLSASDAPLLHVHRSSLNNNSSHFVTSSPLLRPFNPVINNTSKPLLDIPPPIQLHTEPKSSTWLPEHSKPLELEVHDLNSSDKSTFISTRFDSPRSNEATTTKPNVLCRGRSFLGLYVMSWLPLILIGASCIVLTLYFWRRFISIMGDLSYQRLVEGCFYDTEAFARRLTKGIGLQQSISDFFVGFSEVDITQPVAGPTVAKYVTSMLASVSVPMFSTLSYFHRVPFLQRAAFEAKFGTIVQWDATTATFVNISIGSINTVYPALIRLENCASSLLDPTASPCVKPLMGSAVAANGFRFPQLVDLNSLPGMTAIINQLLQSQSTQFIPPNYVNDYNTSNIQFANRGTSPSSMPLSPNAGFRSGFLSAYVANGSTSFNQYNVTGFFLSSFDLSVAIDYLMADAAQRRATENFRAAVDAEEPIPSQTSSYITSIRAFKTGNPSSSADGVTLYDNWVMDMAGSVSLNRDFGDANTLATNQEATYTSWPMHRFFPDSMPQLDWVFECRTSDLDIHFDSLNSLRLFVSALNSVLVGLICLLCYLLLRWNRSVDIERLQKNHSLDLMREATKSAESARDAKSDFLAFVCHELRNPLHAVLGMTDALRETQMTDEQTDSVYTIHASSELMLAITDDILDYAKMEEGRMQLQLAETDLWATIDSLIRGGATFAEERDLKLVAHIDNRAPKYILADNIRLTQVLSNILSNAIKFSEKHREVLILVDVVDEEDEIDSTTSHGKPTQEGGDFLTRAAAQLRNSTIEDEGGNHSSSTHTRITSRPPITREAIAAQLISQAIPAPSPRKRIDVPSQVPTPAPVANTPAHVPTPPPTAPETEVTYVGARSQGPSPPSSDKQESRMLQIPPRLASHALNIDVSSEKSSPLVGAANATPHLPNAIHTPMVTPIAVPRTLGLGGGPHNPFVSNQTFKFNSPKHTSVSSSPAFPVLTEAQRHVSPLDLVRKVQRQHSGITANQKVKRPSISRSKNKNDKKANGDASLHSVSNHDRPQYLKLLFTIVDQGCGIPQEHLSTLFEPYSRAKRALIMSHGGSGLGLALVKRLCDLMDATIHIESQVNRGTRFSFAVNFQVAPQPDQNHAQILRQLQPFTTQTKPRYVTFADLTEATQNTSPVGYVQKLPVAPRTNLIASPTVGPAEVEPFVPLLPRTIGGNFTLPSSSDEIMTHNTGPTTGASSIKQVKFHMDQLMAIGEGNSASQSRLDNEDASPVHTNMVSKETSPLHANQVNNVHLPLTSVSNLPLSTPLVPQDGFTTPRIFSAQSKNGSPPASDESPDRVRIPASPGAVELVELQKEAATLAFPAGIPKLDAAGAQPQQSPVSVDAVEVDPLDFAKKNLRLNTNRLSQVESIISNVFSPSETLESGQTTNDPSLTSESSSILERRITSELDRRISTGEMMSPQTYFRHQSRATDAGISVNSITSYDLPSVTASTQNSSLVSSTFSPSTSSILPSPNHHNGPWILVVDDASINRRLLNKILSNTYRIDEAADGKEALDLVLANPNKYCCVLMDLMMPKMDGRQSVQAIRKEGYTRLPIIAVTANVNEEVEDCLAIGFTAFLSKPCRKEILRAKIIEVVQQAESLLSSTTQPV